MICSFCLIGLLLICFMLLSSTNRFSIVDSSHSGWNPWEILSCSWSSTFSRRTLILSNWLFNFSSRFSSSTPAFSARSVFDLSVYSSLRKPLIVFWNRPFSFSTYSFTVFIYSPLSLNILASCSTFSSFKSAISWSFSFRICMFWPRR